MTIVTNHIDEILIKEKRIEKGSYREYALNYYTTKDYYDFIFKKYPGLSPPLYPYPRQVLNVGEEVNKYTKLLESAIEKLNYNKECLEYLINLDAKTYEEINLENNLGISKKLMKEYQEQLNSVKTLLEEQAGTLETEKKERYLKEEILLQQAINKQQEEIDKIYKNYN